MLRPYILDSSRVSTSEEIEYLYTNGKLKKVPNNKAPYVVANDGLEPRALDKGGSKPLGMEGLVMFEDKGGDVDI